MNSNRVKILFFLGVCTITLHFTILFAKEWIHYLRLKYTAPAHIQKWEIIPLKKEFAVRADFTFDKGAGTYIFPSPHFPNEWAALSEMKKWAKQSWNAYYNDPEMAVLQKQFPLNLLFRMSICCGVLIYLFILRNKLKKFILN